jgi:diacylglycerol O-acyltransferase / wax synthase
VGAAQAGLRVAEAAARVAIPSRDAATVLRAGTTAEKRAAWSAPIPLAELKLAGRGTGSTINDVVLAAVTGALHRYLSTHDAVPADLGVLVPFNLRPLDRPLPPGLGNRFGLVHVSLPVGVPDRFERLAEAKRRMDHRKGSPEGVISFGVLSALGTVPSPAEQLAIGLYTARASAVVGNVPGPQLPLYLAGSRIQRVIPFVPCSGEIGLGVDVFSYDGHASVGITSDAAAVPDPEALAELFAEEIDELRALGVASTR